MVPLWMFPMAIACGNTFVLKPSERDPSASLLLAELLQEAGLPDGVFNVVHGDKEAVDALLDAPARRGGVVRRLDADRAARLRDARRAHGKRVQALGGAKNHAVVLPDADLDLAADAPDRRGVRLGRRAVHGDLGRAWRSATVADALLERLTRAAEKVRVGAGHRPRQRHGPRHHRGARSADRGVVTSTRRRRGARRRSTAAGTRSPVTRAASSSAPPSSTASPRTCAPTREEIFGPVLVVRPGGRPAEAIALVNANPYGNGTAIFTSTGGAARTFQRAVKVGMIGINVPIPVPVGWHSFGGWKDSLFGESHIYGPEAVRFYTRGKVVTSRWPSSPATAKFHFGRTTSH